MDPESVASSSESMKAQNDPVNGPASVVPNLDLLKDIELPVTLRFGSAQMSVRDLTALNTGAVIQLDRALSDPIEVLVGGVVIARGEPIVVQGVYGVRISEIASRQERLMTTSLHTAAPGGNIA
jgi:flagellar motor switch protein FliN/FliY